jgi:hypothetical protein
MFKNAFTPIVGATARLILILVKPEQLSNAAFPIVVTEFGIVKEPVKPLQLLNA